jgi:hypothetical protein
MSDGDESWGMVLVIEAFNDGHRSVVVDEYGFWIQDRFRFTPRRLKGDAFGVRIVPRFFFTISCIRNSEQLPSTLEPGQSIILWLDRIQSKGIVERARDLNFMGNARLVAVLKDKLNNAYQSRPLPFESELWDVPVEPAAPLLPWNDPR